ncbi:DUF445 family protein [soil metagenome]
MKLLALGLLVAAAALYGIATVLETSHPAWPYVAAFAEAAMVGAVADWFAVTALFRHPLGLPIPHTAIIPSNQARIGDRLATFICSNFLANEQVLGKLKAFDPARQLAGWLKDPAHAAQVGSHLSAAFRYALGAFDDARVRGFIQRNVITGLAAVDVSRLAGQMLDALTVNRRHQELLDEVLVQLGKMLENESVRNRIVELIAAEVKVLRYIGLDTVAGKLVTDKIVSGVSKMIGEMGADAEHPMRQRFDSFMSRFIARLKDDPDFRAKGESLKNEMLAHPAVTGYVHGLWTELLAWLHADLDKPESAIRGRIAMSAQTLGDKLDADPAMQEWINSQVMAAAPRWIDRYREDIRRYIVTRVSEWNTDDMTAEVERHVGRDLQFVRINGTLVGGLVGLAIHAVTQWLRLV